MMVPTGFGWNLFGTYQVEKFHNKGEKVLSVNERLF
jgi:hypothetical protein